MTDAADSLVRLLRPVRGVVLDFDGPVCAVFSGVGADDVTGRLLNALQEHGFSTAGTSELGPHALLEHATALGPDAAAAVERELATAEVEAVRTARVTSGAEPFLLACRDTQRPVAIASNNSATAVTEFLRLHDLTSLVAHVEGRDPVEPDRMKPNTWTVTRALDALGIPAANSVMVGDSDSDIAVAIALGAASVGYANKLGKDVRLRDAGANAIVFDMARLAAAVLAAGPAH